MMVEVMRGLSNPLHPASTLIGGHLDEAGPETPGLEAQESESYDEAPAVRRRPKVMQRRLDPDEIAELTARQVRRV